jgi:hypothetical protein
MKENFDKALKFTLEAEGIYSNEPDDPGGETKYGISRNNHPEISQEDWNNFTLDMAKDIYKKSYWDACNCDNLDYPLDILVFDAAVNMGVSNAKKLGTFESLESFILKRIAMYATFKKFDIYGRGWVNRCINLWNFIKRS